MQIFSRKRSHRSCLRSVDSSIGRRVAALYASNHLRLLLLNSLVGSLQTKLKCTVGNHSSRLLMSSPFSKPKGLTRWFHSLTEYSSRTTRLFLHRVDSLLLIDPPCRSRTSLRMSIDLKTLKRSRGFPNTEPRDERYVADLF